MDLISNMAAPVNPDAVDPAQIERFLKMLHAGAPNHVIFASYPEKGQEGTFQWCAYPAGEVHRLIAQTRVRNEEEGRAVAVSVATFFGNNRLESSAASLAAFAIDIDQKDLGNLVPGALSPVDVIPEVRARLDARGLKPHALVSSGNGLHVYVLLDRIFFHEPGRIRSPVFERDRVKTTWKKLAYLLGRSTDRFDLASIMRLPGTVNRKEGGFKRTFFLDERTDLARPRYSFETVEKAVEDVVVAQTRRKKERQGAANSTARQMVTTPLEGWQQKMVQFAVEHDTKFRALRDGARIGRYEKTTDRSKIEFNYACRMLEMGFPEQVVRAEISACAKGSEAGPRYVDSTILKAAARVAGAGSPRTPVSLDTFWSTTSAFYTWKKHGGGLLSRVPVVNWSLPNVSVVIARPGGSKTTDLLDLFSTVWSGIGVYDRVAVCGLFVNELLEHEHTINAAFPAGMRFEVSGRVVEYDRNAIPSTAIAVYKALPDEIKLLSSGNQPIWTVGRLEQHPSPRALLLNALSPYTTDERFDVEEPLLPHSRYPNAVVKFSPREHLCLAGYSQHTLDTTSVCSKECPFTQCRSNMTEDGMRTIWNTASVALLTHKSFEAQVLYQPKKNDFECIIFDELPQSVYRNPCIKVWPTRAGVRGWRWSCEPLDALVLKLGEAVNKLREDLEKLRVEMAKARASNDDDAQEQLARKKRPIEKYLDALPAIIKRVDERRALLVKQAQKAKSERSGKFERMAARDVKPILSTDEFEMLVSLQRQGRVVQDLDDDEYDDEDLELMDEDADDEADEDTAADLGSQLPKFRDFCGDSGLTVYYEHRFTKKTRGSFRVYRPMDAWDDLVVRPGGAGRRIVVLDATAGLDPRYQLLGVAKTEDTPTGSYPNATIVLTSKRTISKSNVENRKVTPWDISGRIARDLNPYRTKVESLLVVTTKKLAPKLRKTVDARIKDRTLPPRTVVEHFGNLRGKNSYRDFDAVHLTHLHRYNEAYYAGLNFLLRPFESFPGKWEDKNATENENGRRVWDPAPLRLRAMISDLFQDAMRIGLRSNPDRECFIFVPSAEAAVVVRLMHLFRGATFVHPAKKAGRSARIAATASDPLGDVFGVADVPADGKPKPARSIRDDLDGHGAQAWGVENKKLLDAEASKPAPPEPPGPREVPTRFWDINMPHLPGELAREGREQLRLVVQGLWNFVRRDAPNEAALLQTMRRILRQYGATDLLRLAYEAEGSPEARANSAVFEIVTSEVFGEVRDADGDPNGTP